MLSNLLNRPGPLRKLRAEIYLRCSRQRDKPDRDYLEHRTGDNAVEWVLYVQRLISENFRENPKDLDHPLCIPEEWIEELTDRVGRIWREQKTYGDENIWVASTLGLVLVLWSARIMRAKAMDPHRPVALRRAAYSSYLKFVNQLSALVTDESGDPEMFDQPWENPFLSTATDGSFV